MKFVIGLIVGALVVAYYPNIGYELRSVTNNIAGKVEGATAPTPTEQIEGMLNGLRK